jgi:hypothetical protein
VALISLWMCACMHIDYNIFFMFSLKESIIGRKRNGVYFKTNFFSFEIRVGSVFKSDNIILPKRTHKTWVWRQAIVFCLCDLVTRSKLRHHIRVVQMTILCSLTSIFLMSFLRDRWVHWGLYVCMYVCMRVCSMFLLVCMFACKNVYAYSLCACM